MNKDKKKIGLALSGGGYRAAAYHVGTLRALHKLGILNKVDVISSVSGGSITTPCIKTITTHLNKVLSRVCSVVCFGLRFFM